MAIVHKFGTITLSMDGGGEYAVSLKDFHWEIEEGESLAGSVSSIIYQIGLKLCDQDQGLWRPLSKFVEKELSDDKVYF